MCELSEIIQEFADMKLMFLTCLVLAMVVDMTASAPSNNDLALDHQECLSLGFNSAEAMPCSVCETLLKVTGEKQMHEECQKCCTSSAVELYELAVLEVDKRSAKRYMHMPDIMERAEAMGLVLRHRRGSPPTLLMYRERDDEDASERIGISFWTAEVLEEYLISHMAPSTE